MNRYLTRTPRGERKRRERGERTPTPTHLARNGHTLKRQEKRKAEADGHKPKDQRRGGGQTRLNQPTKAKPNAYLRTRRTQTYLRGSNA